MYEQMLIFAPHIEFAFGTRASWDDPSTPVLWADPSGVASSCKPYRLENTILVFINLLLEIIPRKGDIPLVISVRLRTEIVLQHPVSISKHLGTQSPIPWHFGSALNPTDIFPRLHLL
jgi:hypothetical protein